MNITNSQFAFSGTAQWDELLHRGKRFLDELIALYKPNALQEISFPSDLGKQGVSQAQPEAIPHMAEEDFIRMVIEARPTNDEVTAYLMDALCQYEKKYKMRSELFYSRFAGAPDCDQPDFIAWAMCYRSYLRVTRLSA